MDWIELHHWTLARPYHQSLLAAYQVIGIGVIIWYREREREREDGCVAVVSNAVADLPVGFTAVYIAFRWRHFFTSFVILQTRHQRGATFEPLYYLSCYSIQRLKIYKKLSCCWQTARRICAIWSSVADPLKHAPPSHVLPLQIWWF